ncbi:MAG TPA: RagB/SusD family nutrient uptake outer membrane protein [Pseudosphingobacterium sp.]|nr:RagB/SusD family nutrient uptake outer membrane protein [Pseudosphingobacterium sp.]
MKKYVFYSLLICICLVTSCNDYLDVKPSKSMTVPEKIKDLQALLDNTTYINQSSPISPELAADNFLVTDQVWNSTGLSVRNAYIWEKDVFNDFFLNDWSYPYVSVFYANLAKEGVEKLQGTSASQVELDFIKGQALFIRAYAFYQLAGVFTKPYNAHTASSDLGIPLRLVSDINEPTSRASVKETYDRIIADLKIAADLLPDKVTYATRASRAAAYALLARVYLSMAEYTEAARYADLYLDIKNVLLDFNELDAAKMVPFPIMHEEDVFHTCALTTGFITPSSGIVDPSLYSLYTADDLRRSLFFRIDADNKTVRFKGDYGGAASPMPYNGLATDEVYLIKAECAARLGEREKALSLLNTFRQKRYRTRINDGLVLESDQAVLSEVLLERRKELIGRGLRWFDFRRLNREQSTAVTLKRAVNGKEYVLPPGDNRYVFQIPLEVIASSGIPQNPY